jgi:zinc protease
MKTNRIAAVLFAAACVTVLAQEPAQEPQDSMKGVVQKKLAPVSKEVLRVKLPRAIDRKLKNGLPVMVIESHRSPSVELDLILPATSLMDPEGLPGVAAATASLMRQGTEKYSSQQIAEKLAQMGASLSLGGGGGGMRGGRRGGGGGGSALQTRLTASSLTENLDELLELVNQVLLHPTFPQIELDRWKEQQRSMLAQMRSTPAFLGDERLRKALYGGDARSVNITAESLEKIKRQDLLDFYKKYYRPGNSLLGVAGDITPDAITARLEKNIGAWASGTAARPTLPLKAPLPEKKMYLVDRPGSVQTQLMLANRALGRKDSDYIACMVMNRVLGQGPSARLFRNIREDKGFTYGVSSAFTATQYTNHFLASSSVRTDVTGAALDEFLSEFRTIREKPVPAEELENVKRAIVAGFALSLESASGVLSQRMTAREYGLPDDYWDTYPEKIMAVTAADVQRVARKYVPLDNVQIIAVGDGGKIAGVLAKYGPVEKYDAEGRKLD